jgi:hypothetical protein
MRWQYYYLYVMSNFISSDYLQPQLDRLGRQGWELAGTIPFTSQGGTSGAVLLFKQPSN